MMFSERKKINYSEFNIRISGVFVDFLQSSPSEQCILGYALYMQAVEPKQYLLFLLPAQSSQFSGFTD